MFEDHGETVDDRRRRMDRAITVFEQLARPPTRSPPAAKDGTVGRAASGWRRCGPPSRAASTSTPRLFAAASTSTRILSSRRSAARDVSPETQSRQLTGCRGASRRGQPLWIHNTTGVRADDLSAWMTSLVAHDGSEIHRSSGAVNPTSGGPGRRQSRCTAHREVPPALLPAATTVTFSVAGLPTVETAGSACGDGGVTRPRRWTPGIEDSWPHYAGLIAAAVGEYLDDGAPALDLYDLVREYPNRPGKGLRGALMLATCEAFGGPRAARSGAARWLPRASAQRISRCTTTSRTPVALGEAGGRCTLRMVSVRRSTPVTRSRPSPFNRWRGSGARAENIGSAAGPVRRDHPPHCGGPGDRPRLATAPGGRPRAR